jgi:hypothetical protein
MPRGVTWKGAGGWLIFSHWRQETFAHGLDHFVPGRNALERFGHYRRQMAQIARAAARAHFRRGDDDLLAREIGGEVAASGSLAGERLDRGGLGSRDLAKQFSLAGIGLQFFEGQLELIEQAPATLGARAIFVAAHLLVHQFEMGVAGQKVGIDRPGFGHLCLGRQCLFTHDGKFSAKLHKLIRCVAGDHARIITCKSSRTQHLQHFSASRTAFLMVKNHPTCVGRQVSCGLRQSTPSSRHAIAEAEIAIDPSFADGQTKRPLSKRFAYNDIPRPSCHKILHSDPLRPLKTYRSPAWTSLFKHCWTCSASDRIPRRMSVCPSASHTLTPPGIGIIGPRP